MPTNLGPKALWEETCRRIREYDMDGFADLFAVDGLLERPFVPIGVPRLLEGREEIRRVFKPLSTAARQAGRQITGFTHVVVHVTSDPDVVVVEFDQEGRAAGTGEPYTFHFIQVLRAHDGQIALLRDYFDSWGMGERLKALRSPPSKE
jgi:ketosteroid isomerase-like protein